jgi:hypothetical protein
LNCIFIPYANPNPNPKSVPKLKVDETKKNVNDKVRQLVSVFKEMRNIGIVKDSQSSAKDPDERDKGGSIERGKEGKEEREMDEKGKEEEEEKEEGEEGEEEGEREEREVEEDIVADIPSFDETIRLELVIRLGLGLGLGLGRQYMNNNTLTLTLTLTLTQTEFI